MASFSGWFSGKTAPDKEPVTETASLLSDWKSYQSKDTMNTSMSSKLLSSAEEGTASMKKLATDAVSSVSAASTSVVEGVQTYASLRFRHIWYSNTFNINYMRHAGYQGPRSTCISQLLLEWESFCCCLPFSSFFP